jgi:hypothetical protein
MTLDDVDPLWLLKRLPAAMPIEQIDQNATYRERVQRIARAHGGGVDCRDLLTEFLCGLDDRVADFDAIEEQLWKEVMRMVYAGEARVVIVVPRE